MINHPERDLGLIRAQQRETEITNQLVAHLKEIDRRQLWRHYGCRSLIEFCIRQLDMNSDRAAELVNHLY